MHFSLAVKAFENNMAETRSQELISSLLEGSIKPRNVISDPLMKKGFRRTRLYLRQDSAFLNRIAEDGGTEVTV